LPNSLPQAPPAPPVPPPPASPPEPPPAPPQLGPGQHFVIQVFQDLMHRRPDTAELATWSGQADQGTDPGEIVRRLQGSAEYQTHLIQDLYGRLLGRAAEPFGLGAWLGYLAAGHAAEEVEAGILGSEEYGQMHGSATAFLAALYQDVLHR